jgi:hypothetical protein
MYLLSHTMVRRRLILLTLDKLTYDVVAAASEVLNLPAEQVLEVFGEYWIEFTMTKGYGKMLEMTGKDMPEFLSNLNSMHTMVQVISCFLSFMPDNTPRIETAHILVYRDHWKELTLSLQSRKQ